ncbi:protein HEATR9-like isoform X1 [Xenopus tropicalis]|uniref:Protein HEATR9-like isoform X1 n=1 Tax=Xenopus tropicalis TaxID=8364 RepID=A0A8J1IXA3_XENTR|nr:protein HEATR9-like isoform X1 [Xenopus tropicalis]
MDLLGTLETSLQKEDLIWGSEESKVCLVSSLEQSLACGEQGAEMPLQTATCLSYVDNHNEKASCSLLTYLEHKDLKFRMKALSALVGQIKLHNETTTNGLVHQLLHSIVFQHRIQAAGWLECIGLERIREQGLEKEVYSVLREKIYSDPLLVVRKAIGMTAGSLGMKKSMWDTFERQLQDPSEKRRVQAVLALGALGLRHKRILHQLLKMVDTDQSESVCVQIVRLFCSLDLKDSSVLRNLKEKEQGMGRLARYLMWPYTWLPNKQIFSCYAHLREASKALKILEQNMANPTQDPLGVRD